MYSYYPEELIEEIRSSNDIIDVVSEYVKLTRKGKDHFGLCPFHKEKTPSFCVVPAKQIYHCFGCGKGGNVIHFIMNIENLDFIESIKLLADRARIQLPEGSSREDEEKARLKREIVKINTEAARFYYNYLNSAKGEKGRKYLGDRKLSEHTLRKFGLGYSPEQRDLTYKYLLDKGFEKEAILKSGIVVEAKSGGYYDRFWGRVIFPIFDVRGNVIGFGGRVTDSSLPKYVNSPETPVYSKGKNLYALNFAKNSGSKSIIIVEGYMDVISLHQCGIINTVASLGTALTESQGRMLKKYAEEIIISYDADTAGQAATIRGLDLLYDLGCNVKVLIVPQGKDPDEFIKKNGPDEFRRLASNALPLIEYKMKVLKQQESLDNIEGEIRFKNKMVDLLVRIDNHIEREMYVKKFSRDYNISEESLFGEINRRMRPKSSFKKQVAEIPVKSSVKSEPPREADKLIHCEMLLISLLCVDNSLYKLVRDKFGVEDFSDPRNKTIGAFVFDKLSGGRGIETGELMNFLNEQDINDFARIIHKECNYEDNGKAVLDIIKRIELHKLEKRQQEILDVLGNKSESSKGDVEQLKIELRTIIMKKKTL